MVGAAWAAAHPTGDETERGLAELAVLTLRANRVPDEDILATYTRPNDAADRAYELQYFRDHGVVIAASRVKLLMRRLIAH